MASVEDIKTGVASANQATTDNVIGALRAVSEYARNTAGKQYADVVEGSQGDAVARVPGFFAEALPGALDEIVSKVAEQMNAAETWAAGL